MGGTTKRVKYWFFKKTPMQNLTTHETLISKVPVWITSRISPTRSVMERCFILFEIWHKIFIKTWVNTSMNFKAKSSVNKEFIFPDREYCLEIRTLSAQFREYLENGLRLTSILNFFITVLQWVLQDHFITDFCVAN